jgi:hypothetical protein
VSDERSDQPEARGPERAEAEAQRRFQHLTGMSPEAARVWVAFQSGRRIARPGRNQ